MISRDTSQFLQKLCGVLKLRTEQELIQWERDSGSVFGFYELAGDQSCINVRFQISDGTPVRVEIFCSHTSDARVELDLTTTGQPVVAEFASLATTADGLARTREQDILNQRIFSEEIAMTSMIRENWGAIARGVKA